MSFKRLTILFCLSLVPVFATTGAAVYGSDDDSADALYHMGRKLCEGAEGEKVDLKRGLRLLEEAIAKGSLEAQGYLASYYYGRGRYDKADDYAVARRLALEPAKKGVAEANYVLGEIYSEGHGVGKDETRGTEYFKKALSLYKKDAESGNSSAITSIGLMYQEGRAVEKDVDKALEYYLKAADLRNSCAMVFAGGVYLKKTVLILRNDENLGIEKQMELFQKLFRKAAEYFRKADDLDNSHGATLLASMYRSLYANGMILFVEDDKLEEEDVPRLLERAIKLDQDNPSAPYLLAECYAAGIGVEEDAKKTIEWYQKAVELGDEEAMIQLGLSYVIGLRVEENDEKGMELLQKAVERENADAMFNLGNVYKVGLAGEINIDKAIEQYCKAAELENDEAMLALGRMYLYGDGVEEDEPKAVEWFRKAAELDNDGAMYELGICYENGYGVKKDKSQAKKWFGKAADSGNEKAAEKLSDDDE